MKNISNKLGHFALAGFATLSAASAHADAALAPTSDTEDGAGVHYTAKPYWNGGEQTLSRIRAAYNASGKLIPTTITVQVTKDKGDERLLIASQASVVDGRRLEAYKVTSVTFKGQPVDPTKLESLGKADASYVRDSLAYAEKMVGVALDTHYKLDEYLTSKPETGAACQATGAKKDGITAYAGYRYNVDGVENNLRLITDGKFFRFVGGSKSDAKTYEGNNLAELVNNLPNAKLQEAGVKLVAVCKPRVPFALNLN